jgi:hypothetical protein
LKELLAGETWTGAAGGASITVNILDEEKLLGPDEFFARTLQKSIEPNGNGVTVFDVSVMVESFTIGELNVGSAAIWSVYDVAPTMFVQTNLGVEETCVAESAGSNRNGAGGVCVVVNPNREEYGLMPPTFFALTLQ